MQNIAFTHTYLFDGRLGSDLQEDVTILVELESRGEATKGTIAHIAPTDATEIPSNHRWFLRFWRELVYYQHFAGISSKRAINIATEQNAKLLGSLVLPIW